MTAGTRLVWAKFRGCDDILMRKRFPLIERTSLQKLCKTNDAAWE